MTVTIQSTRERMSGSFILMVLGLSTGPVHAANPVDAPVRRGLELHVQEFATVLRSNGQVPRLNTMVAEGSRLFVTSEEGQIYEITGGVTTLAFDVAAMLPVAAMQNLSIGGWHGGLRGLAFSPDFPSDQKIYTAAMHVRPSNTSGLHYISDVSNPIAADSVVAEWTLVNGQLDPDSYRELFRIGMPVYDHPIKDLAFGPDGMLYVTHGDGSVQSATAGGGMLNDALGKILRIDPTPSASLPYTIPMDNPFVGDPSMIDEAWSIGHRNPHTLAFDSTGLLIVGEAGRDNIEEINRIDRGGNYGWPDREGTFVHLASGGLIKGIEQLPFDDDQFGYAYPAVQFGHDGPFGAGFVGQAVAGGYAVENGSPVDGEYLFAEFATQTRIYHVGTHEIGEAIISGPPEELTQAKLAVAELRFDHDKDPSTPALYRDSMLEIIREGAHWTGANRGDLRFGQGPGGEVYITSKRNGMVYLITSTLPNGPGGFVGLPYATRIEAEEGTPVGNSAVTTRHDDFTGAGFVDFITAPGSGVEDISINRVTDEPTTVELRYAMGPHGPAGIRTLGVYLNDARVGQAQFSSTGSWDSWSTTTVTVPFAIGENRLSFLFGPTDTGYVNLDHIEVADEQITRVEAESGNTTGTAGTGQSHAGFTGLGFVEQRSGNIEDLSVTRQTSEPTTLNLRYAMGPNGPSGNRTVGVYVNGVREGQAQFTSTGTWTQWANTVVSVPFAIGENTLSFRVDAGDTGWINLDHVVVPDERWTLIEGEFGTALGSSQMTTRHAGFTGDGFVDFFTSQGSGVDDLLVSREATGPTDLVLRYAMGPDGPSGIRTVGVYVDGVRVGQVEFVSTGTWSQWSTTTTTVPLSAGVNRLSFEVGAADTGYINLDHIQVLP